MQSHIVEPGDIDDSSGTIVYVKSYSVKRFAELYEIPRNFGILSIDAEGTGSKVSNFRCLYIVSGLLVSLKNP